MGIVTKTVAGKKYLYQWHYENGKKKETYCGVASEAESIRHANQLELKHLNSEKRYLEDKIRATEYQMNNPNRMVKVKHGLQKKTKTRRT